MRFFGFSFAFCGTSELVHSLTSLSLLPPPLQLLSTMTEIVSDLATELADSYAAAQSSSSQEESAAVLPSASQIYRTGRVLYHYNRDIKSSSSHHIITTSADNLTDGFDQLLSTIPTSYLTTVILNDINYAFAELVFAYASSSTHSPSAVVASIGTMLPLRAHATKLSSQYTWEDVLHGTESICGIYLSRVACGALVVEEDGQDGTKLLQLVFLSLSWVYDCLTSSSDGKGAEYDADSDMKDFILCSLSMILSIGLINRSIETSDGDEDYDEKLTNIMNAIQTIQEALGEYNCALGDMLDKEQSDQDLFVNTLRSTFISKDGSQQQPPQLQYLLAMLRSSPRSSDDAKPAAVPSSAAATEEIQTKPQQLQKQQNMVDIQIEHIHSILPSLGKGYIEEALKCYNHDLGRTLEALLQFSEESGSGGTSYNNIHPRLRTLPKNLPRQLKKSVDHYTANVDLHRGATTKEDGKEHVERQKELIRSEVRRAEEEALLVENVSKALGGLKVSNVDQDSDEDDDDYFQSNRNEYDDDYDDQYDGIGNDGGIGMDEGLYDVETHAIQQKYDRNGAKNEQEMWRKYNKMVRDVESESSFWEENRNLNRSVGLHKGASSAGNADNGEEKKYRGPDKGKKGRLIGPDGKYLPIKRGGKKASAGRGGGGGGNPGRGGPSGRGRGGKTGRGAGKSQGDTKQGEGGGEMSKIQKRRKNDNKAKIGNHHRKDRATKKAAAGM